jgi:hypothetical protein
MNVVPHHHSPATIPFHLFLTDSTGMHQSAIPPHFGVAANMPWAVSHWMQHERQRALAFQHYSAVNQQGPSMHHASHVVHHRDRVEQMHHAQPAPREHTGIQNLPAVYYHHHHQHNDPQQHHHQHARHDSSLGGHAMASAWPDEQQMQPAWVQHNPPNFGQQNMMLRASAPFEWLPQHANTALPWGTWPGQENKPSTSHIMMPETIPDARFQAAPFPMQNHVNLMDHSMPEMQDPSCLLPPRNKIATPEATMMTPKDAHDAQRPIAVRAVDKNVTASTSHGQEAVATEAAPTRRVSEVGIHYRLSSPSIHNMPHGFSHSFHKNAIRAS